MSAYAKYSHRYQSMWQVINTRGTVDLVDIFDLLIDPVFLREHYALISKTLKYFKTLFTNEE